MNTLGNLDNRVEAVRGFNRFYTQVIGVLTEDYLKSPYSLTEARIIYELAHNHGTTAKELCRLLALDAGYLSRILRSFKHRGLIERKSSETDRRLKALSLTTQGQQAFEYLNSHSRDQIETMLNRMGMEGQESLIAAMQAIRHLLGSDTRSRAPYLLRTHQIGDMGWVVHRHGLLYAAEYGWDEHFEALVADIVAKFIRDYDPKKERCWIAERDGKNVGSVFLVKHSKEVAKLRLLLVEPGARGMGIGTRLIDECLRFARQVGYRKITLWTNSVLEDARRLYKKAGFELIESEPHHSFGHDLVSETWERPL
jgi:DNA-binding MarR family transcriptional regulator/GNAT superfamily N-acetyltransferase